MQASKIKIGKEYAVGTFRSIVRARCESIPPKGIYERHQHYLFRMLEIRTGEATSETFRVVSREVYGLWEDHQKEILERRRQQDEEERARTAHEVEINGILAELGFIEEDWKIRGRVGGAAIRVDARVRDEYSGVTIDLPALRVWRERHRAKEEEL